MQINILIVDDSETVRAMIMKTIELTDIPVKEFFEASNGKEALEIIKTKWIDLVLTDIHMPVMDGIEMISRMEEEGKMSSIPIIIVSTDKKKPKIETKKDEDIINYITKPFSPKVIKKAIEKSINTI